VRHTYRSGLGEFGVNNLDILVAEKVMGWTLMNYEDEKVSDDYAGARGNDGWYWEGVNYEVWEWCPSEKIECAWEVVEEMVRLGRFVSIEAHGNKESIPGDWGWRIGIQVSERIIDFHYAETVCLAICEAALKAMEKEYA